MVFATYPSKRSTALSVIALSAMLCLALLITAPTSATAAFFASPLRRNPLNSNFQHQQLKQNRLHSSPSFLRPMQLHTHLRNNMQHMMQTMNAASALDMFMMDPFADDIFLHPRRPLRTQQPTLFTRPTLTRMTAVSPQQASAAAVNNQTQLASPVQTDISTTQMTQPSTTTNPNPMQTLLRADPTTGSCFTDPKSLFSPAQFAELSLKYAPACANWKDTFATNATQAEKQGETGEDGEKVLQTAQNGDNSQTDFFKGVFSNTVVYTISEQQADDEDSDAVTITTPSDATAQVVEKDANGAEQPSKPLQADDDMVIIEANHDDEQDDVAKSLEAADNKAKAANADAAVSKITDNAVNTPTPHSVRPSTTTFMQFSYVSSDLDADLPRYDAEMDALVASLEKQRAQNNLKLQKMGIKTTEKATKFNIARQIEYSPVDVQCQRDHLAHLMNDICLNDNRTPQEKLNVIYNAQFQDRLAAIKAEQAQFDAQVQARVAALQAQQQRFEQQVIEADNQRIARRLSGVEEHANADNATTDSHNNENQQPAVQKCRPQGQPDQTKAQRCGATGAAPTQRTVRRNFFRPLF
jgi:hypothetical protein